MRNFIFKNKLKIIFCIIGATGGFLYWKFIGCQRGTCPVQSVWYWSSLWGAVMGYLLGDLIAGIIEKRKKRKDG